MKGPQERKQYVGKQQGRHQRTEIVQGQGARQRCPQAAFTGSQDPRHQRQLESDETADADDEEEHGVAVLICVAIGEIQKRCTEATDQTEPDFETDKPFEKSSADQARYPRPQSHREQKKADRQRELLNAVTEEIGRDATDEKFVDDGTRCSRKKGGEQHGRAEWRQTRAFLVTSRCRIRFQHDSSPAAMSRI